LVFSLKAGASSIPSAAFIPFFYSIAYSKINLISPLSAIIISPSYERKVYLCYLTRKTLFLSRLSSVIGDISSTAPVAVYSSKRGLTALSGVMGDISLITGLTTLAAVCSSKRGMIIPLTLTLPPSFNQNGPRLNILQPVPQD
jgi:hypothetical protein